MDTLTESEEGTNVLIDALVSCLDNRQREKGEGERWGQRVGERETGSRRERDSE